MTIDDRVDELLLHSSTMTTVRADPDMLRQSLLSPGQVDSSETDDLNDTIHSTVSVLAGNLDASPSRSFLETSLFSHLRALQQTPLAVRIGSDDTADINIPDDDEEDDLTTPAFVRNFNHYIARFRFLLLAAIFCVLWPAGGAAFQTFQKYTDSSFHPIAGSPSEAAASAFEENYAHDFNDPMHPALIVILESNPNRNVSLTDPQSLAYAHARTFSLQLGDALGQTCWDAPCNDDNNNNDDNSNTTAISRRLGSSQNQTTASWIKVSSYYSLQKQQLDWLATNLATPDGLTAIIQVQYLLKEDRTSRSRIKALLLAIEDYGTQHSSQYFDIKYTGIKWFQADLVASTKKDLKHMDVLVLPLALLLLGIVLPRANFATVWIIPLVTMISTVAAWSLVMRPICQVMQITQFTPSIMMSLSLGMGVDYTLFLLARYLEDTSNKRRAINRMLTQGGHVLLLSGLTLMCTFLGLWFLPLQMLKSVGVGAAVSIACALLVNLTVVPALLYTRVGDWIVLKKPSSTAPEDASDLPLNHFRGTPLHSAPPVPPPSIWHRLSKQLLHPYKGLVVLLVTCQVLLPVCAYCMEMKSSISFDLLLPSTSPSLQAFHSLGEKVGVGRLNPYRVLFDGKQANITMTSKEGFSIMHRVLDELTAIDHLDNENLNGMTHIDTSDAETMDLTSHLVGEMETYMAAWKKASQRKYDDAYLLALRSQPKVTTYNGIAIMKNTRIPHKIFVSAKYCGQLKNCPIEFMRVLDAVDNVVSSQNMFATYVTATLATSPFSDAGTAWLLAARGTVERLQDGGALNGVQIHIQGSAAIEYDAVLAVYGAFPKMVVITTLVVFVLMGVFFQSIFPPIRSILSIALTLTFSFGLGVLVYQKGVFDWTDLRALTSIGDEVCWLVPIMAFSIIVGLALDYDVFLISRILEYRLQGYEHKSSIAAGLNATGSIITAAGMIMSLAFGSLMLSSNPVLYQWSFLLTTAVLLDTFVIRTIVVPIVTGMAGKHCWWPRQLPQERICMPEYRDRSEDTVGLLRSLEASSEYEQIIGTPRTP